MLTCEVTVPASELLCQFKPNPHLPLLPSRRSHDVAIGREFYRKLRAVRDALGLRCRFEVLHDDGTHRLAVSEHFMRRIARRHRGGCHGDASSGKPATLSSYRELEHLPCVVVLSGGLRAGLSFPRCGGSGVGYKAQ